jgi:hypothetical protein
VCARVKYRTYRHYRHHKKVKSPPAKKTTK